MGTEHGRKPDLSEYPKDHTLWVVGGPRHSLERVPARLQASGPHHHEKLVTVDRNDSREVVGNGTLSYEEARAILDQSINDTSEDVTGVLDN